METEWGGTGPRQLLAVLQVKVHVQGQVPRWHGWSFLSLTVTDSVHEMWLVNPTHYRWDEWLALWDTRQSIWSCPRLEASERTASQSLSSKTVLSFYMVMMKSAGPWPTVRNQKVGNRFWKLTYSKSQRPWKTFKQQESNRHCVCANVLFYLLLIYSVLSFTTGFRQLVRRDIGIYVETSLCVLSCFSCVRLFVTLGTV